jgi:hypothetical protein
MKENFQEIELSDAELETVNGGYYGGYTDNSQNGTQSAGNNAAVGNGNYGSASIGNSTAISESNHQNLSQWAYWYYY